MARKQSRHGQPAVYNAVSPTLIDGDDSALNVDSSGNLKVSGISGGTASDGTAAPASGTLVLGQYNSSAPTYTSGNATNLQTDVNGNLKITQATLSAGEDLTNNLLQVGGVNATNVAITGKPVSLGAQAVSSENTAVTTSRLAQMVTDLVGKLIVLPYANPENFVNGTTAAIVDTTTTSVIAAEGSGVRTYLTNVIVTNSHATVGTFVKITDGASTILCEGYAAAAGGGFVATFPTPLRGTANTAVNAICVTTGANVIVSASGYKGV